MRQILVVVGYHLRPPPAWNAQQENISKMDQITCAKIVKQVNLHLQEVRTAPPALLENTQNRVDKVSVLRVNLGKEPNRSLVQKAVCGAFHRILVVQEVPTAAFALKATIWKTGLVMNVPRTGSVRSARLKQASL